MYNIVKTSIIQHIMLNKMTLGLKYNCLHCKTQYVQHIHTKGHVFTKYTGMFAEYATIKIWQIFDQNGYLTGF